MKAPEYDIMEVRWLDAQSSMNTFDEDELEKLEPLETHSIGYLLKQTDAYIVLGFCIFGNELTKHHQVIPRGMIKDMKCLRRVTSRKQK